MNTNIIDSQSPSNTELVRINCSVFLDRSLTGIVFRRGFVFFYNTRAHLLRQPKCSGYQLCERLSQHWLAKMYLSFRVFFILCLAPTAQPCDSFREFPVANCTTSTCPIYDENRPGVQMAVCERRYKKTGEMAHACVCINFPNTSEPALKYYPHSDGSLTKCAASWSAAPSLFTTLSVVYVLIVLYALAHVFYIIALSKSRMGCCCNSDGCTKNNWSALTLAIGCLFHVVLKLWRISTQGEVVIGHSSAEQIERLAFAFAFLLTGYYVCLFVAIPFFVTSICDMVFPGEEWAVRRRIINATLWCLAIVTAACYIVVLVVPRQTNGLAKTAARICGAVISVSSALLFVIANVFMYLAVRSMREVRLHAAPCMIQCALVSFLSQCM